MPFDQGPHPYLRCKSLPCLTFKSCLGLAEINDVVMRKRLPLGRRRLGWQIRVAVPAGQAGCPRWCLGWRWSPGTMWPAHARVARREAQARGAVSFQQVHDTGHMAELERITVLRWHHASSLPNDEQADLNWPQRDTHMSFFFFFSNLLLEAIAHFTAVIFTKPHLGVGGERILI